MKIRFGVAVFTFLGLFPLVTFPFVNWTFAASNSDSGANAGSYWTCPMHPQIHKEHPGECPICHMKLVKVADNSANTSQEKSKTESEHRKSIEVTPSSFESLNVQKVEVERMDLNIEIPVSGHLVSSRVVAFQIYESDLHQVKVGLSFKGESTFRPGNSILGIITSVDTVVDPTSRTVRVLGQIQSGPQGLIGETTFSGMIHVPLKNVIAVPENAVVHLGGKDLVYAVEKGTRLVPRTVKLGLKSESYYVVHEGVKPGELISSGPNFLFDSEARLRGAGEQSDNHSHH